jgi:hypothetical protein
LFLIHFNLYKHGKNIELMMASGREKREKAGEKLKDIEINDSGESDVEFQDSIEQQVSEDAINDIPDDSNEIQDLERELQRLTRNVCITKYARLYKLSNGIMVMTPK